MSLSFLDKYCIIITNTSLPPVFPGILRLSSMIFSSKQALPHSTFGVDKKLIHRPATTCAAGLILINLWVHYSNMALQSTPPLVTHHTQRNDMVWYSDNASQVSGRLLLSNRCSETYNIQLDNLIRWRYTTCLHLFNYKASVPLLFDS